MEDTINLASTISTPCRRWVFCILAALSLLNVWPLMWFQYLPFMDHPSHLVQANILAHLHSPLFQYDRFFTPNTLPVPNLLNDYLTALLGQFFSIDVASRLMVGLALVLLPLSVWFYLSQTRPGTEPWALFAVPMAWSRFLIFGNENFSLAVPLLFLLLGLLGSWNSRVSPRKSAVILILVTSIYFAHFLVFAVAGLAFTLHFLFGKRDGRNALLHFGPFVPASLLVLYWFAKKSAGEMSPLSFDLEEKLQAFIQGLCPVPWGGAVQSVAWTCLCLSVFIFIGMGAFRLFREPEVRYIAALVLCCCVLAFLFQRWIIIFIPDQRMWWMTLMIGFALLPKLSAKSLVPLGIFAVPLTIGTALALEPMFSVPNQQLAMVENAFSKFPSGLRLLYFGDPALPPHLHRAFEYYHLRKGGLSTQSFSGRNDSSVDYKSGVFLNPVGEQFGMFSYSATAWVPYLDNYDGALIIGDPNQATQAIVSTLTNKGFRVAASGGITLLLSPNYRQAAAGRPRPF